jgi:hypothetical protein
LLYHHELDISLGVQALAEGAVGIQETIARIRNSGGDGEERVLLPVELVVAADVLYDAEAAAHLASVVTELVSTCNGTAPHQ